MMVQQKPSPELVAANERLLHLRAQYRAQQTAPASIFQMALPIQGETMQVRHYADRLELNTAGGNYSPRF